MIRAGQLNRKIQFLRYVSADDGFSEVKTWAAHGGLVWASREVIGRGESYRAGEVAASEVIRFVVRHTAFSSGITPKDRLKLEGVAYEITSVTEIGRRKGIEIIAGGRVDGDS